MVRPVAMSARPIVRSATPAACCVVSAHLLVKTWAVADAANATNATSPATECEVMPSCPDRKELESPLKTPNIANATNPATRAPQ